MCQLNHKGAQIGESVQINGVLLIEHTLHKSKNYPTNILPNDGNKQSVKINCF